MVGQQIKKKIREQDTTKIEKMKNPKSPLPQSEGSLVFFMKHFCFTCFVREIRPSILNIHIEP